VKALYRQQIPNFTDEARRRLLDAIGAKDVNDLFSDMPSTICLKRPLKLPRPLSEHEVRREVEKILSRNVAEGEILSFLGGGIWLHIVPAVVDAIASRAEFLTSYTPYQPEASQGMLQALFEYQSLMSELLDMPVVNCSMYDWASALGEGARMACRLTGRKKVLYPHFIHPERLAVLRTYTEAAGIRLIEVSNRIEDGQVDIEDLKNKVSSDTAVLYVENPSYLGPLMTNLTELSEIVHDIGGLFMMGVDPTSLGLLRPPSHYGADIAVGEGQPLGSYINFGGPLLGIFACRDDPAFIRQIPGRLIGMTTTKDGQTGYCMVLQTREQHIRREKATSNICTNEALMALRAAVYLALLGPKGLRSLGEYVTIMANYLMRLLSYIDGVEAPAFNAPHFKEFTLTIKKRGMSVKDLNIKLLKHGMIGGHPVVEAFPELGESALCCVTERHTKDDLERFARAIAISLDAGNRYV
jgi:glycine dehydrogenase subunit 1